MMIRKLYVSLFVAFAAIFVPVLLSFGIVEYVFPAAWIALAVMRGLAQGEIAASLWSLGHLIGFLLVFYGAARVTFAFSSGARSRMGRWAIQGIALLALFSCSFLRVITYSSIQGRGGTYTLWGAASRYLETQRVR